MAFVLTPAIKGQLTKAINAHIFNDSHAIASTPVPRRTIQRVFERYMPREQAKHASCVYYTMRSK